MTTIHNLGFPRIGARRELKFALEAYWKGESTAEQLATTARDLKQRHWETQIHQGLDLLPVGDFSLYDHVLDTSFLLGNIPQRFLDQPPARQLDQYFRVARGRAPNSAPARASEMTKWFDTNYHYIVPEFNQQTRFSLNPAGLLDDIQQAPVPAEKLKPIILGPLTYLWLGKSEDGLTKLALLPQLLEVYGQLINQLVDQGVQWLQIDEPILALDLPSAWRSAFELAYNRLQTNRVNVLLATYFGPLRENLSLVAQLPVAGLHVDAVRGREEVTNVIDKLPGYKVISLGVIDGRNIWRSHLNPLLDWLEPLRERLGQRLWLAPSCSLLHVPVDLAQETELDAELHSWLAFAHQKLEELSILGRALNQGRNEVARELDANATAQASRAQSTRVHDAAVRNRVTAVTPEQLKRQSPYAARRTQQQARFNLPLFPSTTIGSFPQTPAIRQARQQFRQGTLPAVEYDDAMAAEIKAAVEAQEQLGLDVLVHGEAERNDMVEYFGEQLNGYAFTRFGWVQSYGSRCVKPPIIYGDVARPAPMTVRWSTYAQSLTAKPMKGMLTGPITMLQWSFVRDDQPRSDTARQIALALRDEVQDLEQAGIAMIQVDEPAIREGLPLRRDDWPAYLKWAVAAFRLATSGVADHTQIHTHMCYSEFNDIMPSIADLDADVITIETSRSAMELLDAFVDFEYPNEIGPGVYDIHTPNLPRVEEIVELMKKALDRLPRERLWINPDCGLKTRTWEEVKPALANMVEAGRLLREEHAC